MVRKFEFTLEATESNLFLIIPSRFFEIKFVDRDRPEEVDVNHPALKETGFTIPEPIKEA